MGNVMGTDYTPNWGSDAADEGFPACPQETCRCQQYDGKRCQLTGFKPHWVCKPAVQELYRRAKAQPRGYHVRVWDDLGDLVADFGTDSAPTLRLADGEDVPIGGSGGCNGG
jgi:hypothetical protein